MSIFGKTLAPEVYRQAMAVVVLSAVCAGSATGILMILTDFSLEQLLFESISAFATVGLSTGITANISVAGQLILILLMFVGRLGPILFASALALRERPLLDELPTERPVIG